MPSHQRSALRALSLVVAVLAAAALGGCKTAFAPVRLDSSTDLRGVQEKTQGGVSVATAILTDDQAREHFGVDLGAHGLQALWLRIHNDSPDQLWLIRNVIDPDFYSAEEAALLVEDDVRGGDSGLVRQYFRDESIRVQLRPWTVNEGYLFLPRTEGGRYVDIRLSGDVYDVATQQTSALSPEGSPVPGGHPELRFGFALPLPDGDFDYERLDTSHTYQWELPELGTEELRTALEELPPCTTDGDGERSGDPLNVVIVGAAEDVLNSLSRSGWSFTHRITLRSVGRMIGAALKGKPYPVAPVSSLYLFGRKQDFALQRARHSLSQRNHVRFWLAPFLYEGHQVWVGQVSRDIGIKLTTRTPSLTTHIIDPEVDLAREYLLHSLLAGGFVDRFGFVKGGAQVPPSAPARNLTDDPYYTDGMRLVIVLSSDPIPYDEVCSLGWERSAPPIAQGQSEAAEEHNRVIDPETHEVR